VYDCIQHLYIYRLYLTPQQLVFITVGRPNKEDGTFGECARREIRITVMVAVALLHYPIEQSCQCFRCMDLRLKGHL
jgi:hypothetical protein